MIRLTVLRSGPPSSPLSTSTPGPIARQAASITACRGRETAIAFLNTAHAGLGGRPLDLATASDAGRNSVEAEIGRLAYASPDA